MSELLAPAGSFEALVAAISNGADAIYLGMNRFGARAYASNFDLETLTKAVEYAHLRNVKIYVTLNTIVFEDELLDMKQMLYTLDEAHIDGLIIQDLAVLHEVLTNHPSIEAHCSTQMGIDDLEATLLFKELGVNRVVLAREVEIETIKKIKKIAKIPLEIFIHGALCVSYSGNCFMSGLIGYRSGNRGRCVGSCRKPYELIDMTNNITYPKSYLLSMKDLNTIDYINDLKNIDSLKIEGRMKEPAYVANIVDSYRKKIDGEQVNVENLQKTFHRTFTKGYIFHEDKKDVTNIEKPNNYGFLIGVIYGQKKDYYQLKLSQKLSQGDIIRIDHNGEDINLTAQKIYDSKGNFINSSDTTCFIKLKEKLSIGDKVYKTKDIKFYSEVDKTYPKEYRKFPIDCVVYAYENQPLIIHTVCENKTFVYQSDTLLEKAKNQPTSAQVFEKQWDRLTDSVYCLGRIEYHTDEVFIPATMTNIARRIIIENLSKLRLERTNKNKGKEITLKKYTKEISTPILTVFANTKEQCEAAMECGIETIYYKDNVVRRNNVTYPDKIGPILVGGYGGIYAYKNKNTVISDFSLNVVNSKAVQWLHNMGVERVTLSYELNRKEIQDLIEAYQKTNGGLPNLEMIVYGRADLMYTKYCPLKKQNLCGKCKENQYVIKDDYGSFPILTHSDCTTTILNGKILNLIDELETISSIHAFRVQLTIENKEESIKIIKQFQNKIANKNKTNLFDPAINTRGHFNKEIL